MKLDREHELSIEKLAFSNRMLSLPSYISVSVAHISRSETTGFESGYGRS